MTEPTNELDSMSCFQKKELGYYYYQSFMNRLAYDTLKSYIENCYYMTYEASPVFSTLGSATGGMLEQGDTVITEFREWLKSVLYLNRDTIYYCADVEAMAGTFGVPGKENGDAWLYVMQYLVDSVPCPSQNYLKKEIKKYLDYRYTYWKDTVQDSTLTPYDSVRHYTLEELDLTILRNIKAGVYDGKSDAAPFLIASRKNPFSEQLELKYTLSNGAMLRCDIYDILGHTIYESPLGWKDKGEHFLNIDSKNWANGTYYVRLATLRGETSTVKLLKQ